MLRLKISERIIDKAAVRRRGRHGSRGLLRGLGFHGMTVHGRRGALHLVRIFGAFVARQRTDHHTDAAANHLGIEVLPAVRRNVREKFVDDLEAKFLVLHFASAEFKHDFHLHVLAQKADGVLDLDGQVVRDQYGG